MIHLLTTLVQSHPRRVIHLYEGEINLSIHVTKVDIIKKRRSQGAGVIAYKFNVRHKETRYVVRKRWSECQRFHSNVSQHCAGFANNHPIAAAQKGRLPPGLAPQSGSDLLGTRVGLA